MKKALFFVALSAFVFLMGCNPAEVTSAKVYLQQENYTAALEQLKVASEKYPDNAYAHNLLGQVYGELDSFEQMNAAFEKALAIDSTYKGEIEEWRGSKSQENFNKGIKAAEAKRWDRAIGFFETALKAKPDFVDAYKNLAFIYTQMGDVEKSIQANEQAFAIANDDESLIVELSNQYIKKDEFDRALSMLEKAGETDNVFVKLQFARIYIEKSQMEGVSDEDKQKLYEKTLKYLADAEKLNPENADVLFSSGEICYQLKDYACAAEKFDKYLKLKPDDFSAYYNLILALRFTERFEDGIKIGEIMTEKFPGSAESWSQYGIVLGFGKDSKEDKIMAAISVSIGNAIIALESGDATKAIAEFKKANKPGFKEKFETIISAAKADDEIKQKVRDGLK